MNLKSNFPQRGVLQFIADPGKGQAPRMKDGKVTMKLQFLSKEI